MIRFRRRDSDYKILNKSKLFDSRWYKKNYAVRGNAINHYVNYGAKFGYNPSPVFSRIKYELIYDDVRYVKANPLLHYEKFGCYEEKFTDEIYICDKEKEEINAIKKKQDELIEKKYNRNLENLIVFLVPEFDLVNGGVMSINSIASVTKKLKKTHNSDVIICTVPNPKTFNKYSKFNSEFDIYRFSQLFSYFKSLKKLILHIPEVYVYPFLYCISPEEQLWLKNIDFVQINVLNQNIDLMPRPRLIDYLKELSNKVTITCAHKKYCVAQLRTSYNVDVHMLSTSNFTKYKYLPYSKKDNLLVYSLDLHPMKSKIIDKIRADFPFLKMKEIKNMSYSEYLDTISKAKWMITFGEGLDGYFCESIRSGTMAFSVYNMNFFDDSYDGMPNVFNDYSDMYDNITNFIKKYDNSKMYKQIVDKCIDIDKKMYDDNQYVENIKQYYLGNYTLPMMNVYVERDKRIKGKPLISVVLASYNGEKYIEQQLISIFNQNYSNIEIIVSDDGSSDDTLKILNKYKDKIKILKNRGCHGFIGNFVNGIKHCNGEYIALSDQDDIWEPDKLDILLERIDEFDIIHSGVCVIDEAGNYHKQKVFHDIYEIDKTTKYEIKDNIIENTMLGCTSLMRASFVKKYLDIPDAFIYHDLWFLYNAIINGNGVVYVDQQLTKFRQHSDNASNLIYNSDSWKDKKIALDMYMVNSFSNLDDKLKKLFLLDKNYYILKNIFNNYMPNSSELFLKSNYFNMDSKILINFYNQFGDDIVKYNIK